MKKTYCFNMELYPLYMMQDHIKAHVDKWARVRNGVLNYSLKNKRTGKWVKKTLSLIEAQRITGELYE